MKKIIFGSFIMMGIANYFLSDSIEDKFFKENNIEWWAQAMASGGESGGVSHSLSCDNGIGICSGECGIHQVKMTKNGNADTAVFTCGS